MTLRNELISFESLAKFFLSDVGAIAHEEISKQLKFKKGEYFRISNSSFIIESDTLLNVLKLTKSHLRSVRKRGRDNSDGKRHTKMNEEGDGNLTSSASQGNQGGSTRTSHSTSPDPESPNKMEGCPKRRKPNVMSIKNIRKWADVLNIDLSGILDKGELITRFDEALSSIELLSLPPSLRDEIIKRGLSLLEYVNTESPPEVNEKSKCTEHIIDDRKQINEEVIYKENTHDTHDLYDIGTLTTEQLLNHVKRDRATNDPFALLLMNPFNERNLPSASILKKRWMNFVLRLHPDKVKNHGRSLTTSEREEFQNSARIITEAKYLIQEFIDHKSIDPPTKVLNAFVNCTDTQISEGKRVYEVKWDAPINGGKPSEYRVTLVMFSRSGRGNQKGAIKWRKFHKTVGMVRAAENPSITISREDHRFSSCFDFRQLIFGICALNAAGHGGLVYVPHDLGRGLDIPN